MDQELEKLDKSMKSLYLNLMKYREDDPHYKEILGTLAKQYEACNTLIALAHDDMMNTYDFKYSDMEDIKLLLTNAGYLEQAPKAKH